MKRIRKLQPAWQKEFDWVFYQEETSKMYRSTCWKYAELADKSNPMYIGCGEEKLQQPIQKVDAMLFVIQDC